MTDVMTVTGPVSADDLGVVLPHEHIFCETVREYRAEGLLDDVNLAIAELGHYAAAGGQTVVDMTTSEIGRDPRKLAEVSTATGVQIVMGCGHYRDPYLDQDRFDRLNADDLATNMIDEVRHGVGDTGVRPGIIGEIGCDRWYVSAAEERSFRAAARTHHDTGLTISTHAARWPVGHAQLDLLEAEGVHPGRVVVGHCDSVPGPTYQVELARRGCYVELDGFGTETEYDMARGIGHLMELRGAGFLSSVLLSQDVFLRSHMKARGGPGYDFLLVSLLPRLRDLGLTQAEVHQLIVENPRAALTGERL